MTEPLDVGELFLGETFEPEWKLTRKKAGDGTEEATTGLTMTSTLHATEADALANIPIHAQTVFAMNYRANDATLVYGQLAGSIVDTRLTAYAGQAIWEVLRDSTGALRKARKWRVIALHKARLA